MWAPPAFCPLPAHRPKASPLHVGDVARAIREDMRGPDPHQDLAAGEVREQRIVEGELRGPKTRRRFGLSVIAMNRSPTCGLLLILPRLLNMPLPS